MAYYGELSSGMGCKMCPRGHFVPPANAPGKALTECVLCPEGSCFTNNILMLFIRTLESCIEFAIPSI